MWVVKLDECKSASKGYSQEIGIKKVDQAGESWQNESARTLTIEPCQGSHRTNLVQKQVLAWKWSRKLKYSVVPGITTGSNKGEKELQTDRYYSCALSKTAAIVWSIIHCKLMVSSEAQENEARAFGIYDHSGRAKSSRSSPQLPKEHDVFFSGESFIRVHQMRSKRMTDTQHFA